MDEASRRAASDTRGGGGGGGGGKGGGKGGKGSGGGKGIGGDGGGGGGVQRHGFLLGDMAEEGLEAKVKAYDNALLVPSRL